MEELQAIELLITSAHAELLASMPFLHREALDRMIFAQCLVETLAIATTNSVFTLYGVQSVLEMTTPAMP